MTIRRNSVAVVTGAGSGIGRALAKRLAAEGIVGLAIADVNREGLEETAAMLVDANVSLHVVDVADRAAMASFVDAVISEHGRVTHVINNAGVALGGTLKEVSLDEIEWLMGVNFWGVVHGTKLFLPYLVKEPEAHIVNISSLFGLVAPPGQTAYCASKFAVRGFTEALRHELEDTNIAVSVVHPGGVKTNIANSARIAESSEITADELEQRLARMNRNLSTTTPDRAAEIIIKGIKKRSPRIIVGPDAQLLSWIQRLFPKRYLAIANAISGGKLKET